MNPLRHTDASIVAPAALVVLVALALGCGEELEVPRGEASIEAAGEIETPVENCQFDEEPPSEVTADAGDADDDAEDAGASNEDDAIAETGQFRAEITRVNDAVSIPYVIRDREGDDQRVRVEICTFEDDSAQDCGTAVRSPGDDGTYLVPTSPTGACVLHVFYWDVGCGRFVSGNDDTPERRIIDDVDQPLVARVSVVDSDNDPVETRPFALNDDGLDFDTVPACE